MRGEIECRFGLVRPASLCRLRRRHVVSRGMLRLILSTFNGQNPRAIRICTGSRGKPYVAGDGPHFSLSRSSDVALVAITNSGPIGVDIERVRPDLGIDSFACAFVASPEVARIQSLPIGSRTRAWFQVWTRLEAVAKASGEGLLEYVANDSRESPPFRTWNIDVDESHVGAVAAPQSVSHLVYESLPNITSALSRFGAA
jgi:4'-phosphopantetheinyl transferase